VQQDEFQASLEPCNNHLINKEKRKRYASSVNIIMRCSNVYGHLLTGDTTKVLYALYEVYPTHVPNLQLNI